MRKAAGLARRNVAGMSECGDEIVDKFESGVATQTNTVAILPPMTGCMRGELRFSALFCGQRLRIFGAKAGGFDGFCGLLRRCGRDNAKPNRNKRTYRQQAIYVRKDCISLCVAVVYRRVCGSVC